MRQILTRKLVRRRTAKRPRRAAKNRAIMRLEPARADMKSSPGQRPGTILMAWRSATAATLIAFATCSQALGQQSLTPADMPRIAEIDARFQSYNVEMVEVTGGRFWKPYGRTHPPAEQDIYAYRPPIDLTNARLRKLAAALSPAYLRV